MLLLPIVLAMALFLIFSCKALIGDFGNYYYASKFLVRGNWGTWIYEPIAFNKAIYELGQRNFFLNYTPVPPLTALLYAPFSFLNLDVAKLIWNLVNVALFFIAIFKLHQLNKLTRIWLVVFALITLPALRSTIMEGQSYLLILFLLVQGFYHYTKGSYWLMAICWALAIHLKITPVIVLFFLLVEKQWKPIFYLISVTIVLLLLSVPCIGFDVWFKYISTILPRLFSGEINDTYATNYQSAQVFFKQLFYPDVLHNPNAIVNNPYWYLLLWNGFKYAIIAVAMHASRLESASSAQRFGIWITVSFLVSGYGNSFSLLLLLIPISCFYSQQSKSKQILSLVFLAGIFWLSYRYFLSYHIMFRFPRLVFLLLFFGLIIEWKQLKQLFSLLLLVLIAVVLTTRKPPVNNSNYLFDKEIALLCYDYQLINSTHLRVFYFDLNGPQHKDVRLPFEVKSLEFATYSTQTLMVQENIQKVARVNQTKEIYLSDYNRGVGFYTLRVRDYQP